MTRENHKLIDRGLFKLWMTAFIICLCAASSFALNKFDGQMRDTENYKGALITGDVTVYAWTPVYDSNGVWIKTTLSAASGLYDCSGTAISGNTVTTSSSFFCFQGSNATYYIKMGSSGTPYLWLSETTRARDGAYLLSEFGGTADTSKDNTYPLKNAMAYIGCRPEGSGGKLEISNGVFKVGAGTRPPVLPDAPGTSTAVSVSLPVVLPPGLTFEGTTGKDFHASSRIQIDAANLTVFKIGGLSNNITMRDLGIVATASITDSGDGTTAILATDEPITGGDGTNYSSFHVLFSNIEVRGFKYGINAVGKEDSSHFRKWQFDYIRIENSAIEGLFAITMNTRNSDWSISNTMVDTTFISGGTRGVGILVKSAANVSLDNVYGGGYATSVTNRLLRPEAFLKVTGTDNGHSTISMHSCQSENTAYSILYDIVDPTAPELISPLYIEASGFGDPIAIKSNVTIVSIGNSYGADTFKVFGQAQSGQPSEEDGDSYRTKIYSYGDIFNAVTFLHKGCPPADSHLGLTAASEADCRRDFYVYNNWAASPTEENAVVVKTGQKKDGTYDHSSINASQLLSPLKIFSPPIYIPTLGSGDNTRDHFKAWGYTLTRNTTDGFLDFEGNQKSPESAYNYTGFRFYGSVYPSADNTYEMGNASKRWSLVRATTITPGDLILSNKKTGKELYKIHEDEDYIYFDDIRTGKQLMKLDTEGNLILSGRIYQKGETPPKTPRKTAEK